MKDWYASRPDLFHKRPYDRPGCDIKNILRRFCIGAVVTAEEDQTLNKLGLRAKMPEGWDGKYPWARYRVAKIEIITKK